MLASTANYLVGLGWRRGEPWLSEVRVPATLPWQQAISTSSCRAPNGPPMASPSLTASRLDDSPASLLPPMGRFGLAFLAYDNFRVYLQWNNALVYSTTAAYLATALSAHRRSIAAIRRRYWLSPTSRRSERAWCGPATMSARPTDFSA